MKKFLALAVATTLMSTSVLAANVEVNGVKLDQEAVIVDGRTLVPVRGVFEKLGFTVEFEAETKTATLTRGSQVVVMTLGNTYFTVNDKEITPEVPQQIIDDSFMLPLRAVAEGIGVEVNWNQETKTASVIQSKGLIVLEDSADISASDINTIITE